jgi:hypothetical protein
VSQRYWCAVLILGLAACTPQLRQTPPAPTAEPVSVVALAAAIDLDAKRSDQEPDSKVRGELAAEASRDADICLSREPQAAACLYGRAVALGLMARAHPTRAGEFLNGMLDALGHAEAADSDYDEAGPARVRALVLIRAPGWPLGPGDTDAGLIAARRAVTLRPLYPPNLLALAEALGKSGDGGGARAAYVRAREAALALPAAPNREAWLHEADQGLLHKP